MEQPIKHLNEYANQKPERRALLCPSGLNSIEGTYTYRELETLGKMTPDVIGRSADIEIKEIIVYCGVGGYAGAWWFVLTQVLEYENVRIYDGSAQEWSRHYDMVID